MTRPWISRSGALLLAAAFLSSPASSEQPASQPEKGATVAYTCTATFFDRQDGEEVGKKEFDYSLLPVDRDPVKTCLQEAAAKPMARAMAFACECRKL